VYSYKDGRTYVGSWEQGFKHGRGTLRYPTGTFYAGDFFRDFCQGLGTLTEADGKRY